VTGSFLYRYKLHHLLFWVLFFAGWYYFRYQDFDTKQEAILQVLIRVLDLAFMVYIVNYLLIPRLLYKKKYLWFALSFFGLVSASSLFKIYCVYNAPNEEMVREHAKQGGFPANAVNRVYSVIDPTTAE